MSLLNEALLSRDSEFHLRVEAAMARAADDVANEAPETDNHDARMRLAVAFHTPGDQSREMAIAAMVRQVASNPTVRSAATAGDQLDQAAVTDSDIQYVVNSSWSRVAELTLPEGTEG